VVPSTVVTSSVTLVYTCFASYMYILTGTVIHYSSDRVEIVYLTH